jgi:hypothetical protein
VLTELQETLAEAHALAIAAATVTLKVEERTPVRRLVSALEAMRREADDTRARCLDVEGRLPGGVGDELLARVNTTRERAGDLANAWFKAGTRPLAAWSFLSMGEAAEVAVWSALQVLARSAGDAHLAELADWAVPIQQRHLATALDGAAQLAGLSDPDGPRGS